MAFKKGEIPPGAVPFEKGQSGNPGGRPPKDRALQDALDMVLAEEKKGESLVVRIVKKLGTKALQGDIKAATLLLAHAYGQPRQRMEHTVDPEPGAGAIQWVIKVPPVQTEEPGPSGKKRK